MSHNIIENIMPENNTLELDEVVVKGRRYVLADSIPMYTPRQEGPWEIGKAYFVRTVTMAIHGTLVDVTPQELVFIGAAWIADTGRFHQFITGESDPNEIEPFPRNASVIVGRGALVDAVRRDGTFGAQK